MKRCKPRDAASCEKTSAAKQTTLFQSWGGQPTAARIPQRGRTGGVAGGGGSSSSDVIDLGASDSDEEAALVQAMEEGLRRHSQGSPSTAGSSGFDDFAGKLWIYPTNLPVRDYQLNIARAALFENTLVSLPTGLGKTFIAAVVMYNFYRWYPRGRTVFMAPTKPLVAQQMEACYNIMGIPQEDMAEMTGTISPTIRQNTWKTKRIIFLTPQVLMNDLSRGSCSADFIKCVIVDEAHKSLGNHAYCQVIRELVKHTREFRVLALSATPGSNIKAVQQVITNLLISHLELRTEDSADIREYSHERKVEKIVVSLGKELIEVRNKYVQILEMIVHRLTSQNVLYNRNIQSLSKFFILKAREAFRQNPPDHLQRSQIGVIEGDFALVMSLFHGYELLQLHGLRSLHNYLQSFLNGEKGYGRARAELLQCAEFSDIVETLKNKFGSSNVSFSQLNTQQKEDPFIISHPKMEKLQEIVCSHFEQHQKGAEFCNTRIMIFSQYRDSVREITEMLKRCSPLVKAMNFIGQSSSGKITKGLTQKDQLKVMKQFREGGYNTLVSTCVGEEGLDIGDVDLIICFDAHKSPVRLVQRMGRTGRKRKGRIVMLITEGKEEQIYNQSQCLKRNLNRAVLNGTQSIQYYCHSPRMVPNGLQPRCHKMFITVMKPFAGKVKTTKALGCKKNYAKTEFLTETELQYWNKYYKVGNTALVSLPQGGYFLCLGDEFQVVDDDNMTQLSLTRWLPWQNRLHDNHIIGNSMVTRHFVELMEFIELQRTLDSSTDLYTMEIDTYLNEHDILKTGEKDRYGKGIVKYMKKKHCLHQNESAGNKRSDMRDTGWKGMSKILALLETEDALESDCASKSAANVGGKGSVHTGDSEDAEKTTIQNILNSSPSCGLEKRNAVDNANLQILKAQNQKERKKNEDVSEKSLAICSKWVTGCADMCDDDFIELPLELKEKKSNECSNLFPKVFSEDIQGNLISSFQPCNSGGNPVPSPPLLEEITVVFDRIGNHGHLPSLDLLQLVEQWEMEHLEKISHEVNVTDYAVPPSVKRCKMSESIGTVKIVDCLHENDKTDQKLFTKIIPKIAENTRTESHSKNTTFGVSFEDLFSPGKDHLVKQDVISVRDATLSCFGEKDSAVLLEGKLQGQSRETDVTVFEINSDSIFDNLNSEMNSSMKSSFDKSNSSSKIGFTQAFKCVHTSPSLLSSAAIVETPRPDTSTPVKKLDKFSNLSVLSTVVSSPVACYENCSKAYGNLPVSKMFVVPDVDVMPSDERVVLSGATEWNVILKNNAEVAVIEESLEEEMPQFDLGFNIDDLDNVIPPSPHMACSSHSHEPSMAAQRCSVNLFSQKSAELRTLKQLQSVKQVNNVDGNEKKEAKTPLFGKSSLLQASLATKAAYSKYHPTPMTTANHHISGQETGDTDDEECDNVHAVRKKKINLFDSQSPILLKLQPSTVGASYISKDSKSSSAQEDMKTDTKGTEKLNTTPLPSLSCTRIYVDDDSLDDFEELEVPLQMYNKSKEENLVGSVKKEKFHFRKRHQKNKRCLSKEFLDQEADLSEDGDVSSDEVDTSDQDALESSFINDDTRLTQHADTIDMEAVYLESVKDHQPPQPRFKLNFNKINQSAHSDLGMPHCIMESQYIVDSFCVMDNLDEEHSDISGEVTPLKTPVYNKEKKKRKRKRVIHLLTSSEDEAEAAQIPDNRELFSDWEPSSHISLPVLPGRDENEEQKVYRNESKKLEESCKESETPGPAAEKEKGFLSKVNENEIIVDTPVNRCGMQGFFVYRKRKTTEDFPDVSESRVQSVSSSNMKTGGCNLSRVKMTDTGINSKILSSCIHTPLKVSAELPSQLGMPLPDSIIKKSCSETVHSSRLHSTTNFTSRTEMIEQQEKRVNPQKQMKVDPCTEAGESTARLCTNGNSEEPVVEKTSIPSRILSRTAAAPASHADLHSTVQTSGSTSGKLAIFVDSREISGSQDIVSDLRLQHRISVTVRQLSGCDYIISNRAAVERKLLSDFANSANRNKLIDRLQHMCLLFDCPCVIVEKDRIRYGEKFPKMIHLSQYFDTLLAQLSQCHIKLLFSDCQADTATLLASLCQREQQKGMAMDVPRDLSDLEEQMMRFYNSIPKMSYINSLNMCRNIKNIDEFLHSTVKMIATKGQMSELRAAEVHKFVHQRFNPQMCSGAS